MHGRWHYNSRVVQELHCLELWDLDEENAGSASQYQIAQQLSEAKRGKSHLVKHQDLGLSE